MNLITFFKKIIRSNIIGPINQKKEKENPNNRIRNEQRLQQIAKKF